MKHRKLLSLGPDATSPVAPTISLGSRPNPSGLRGWVANPGTPQPPRSGPAGWIA